MLTIMELAAFTGLSYSKIYRIIRQHNIKPQGFDWKLRYYDAREVLRYTGTEDRLTTTRASVKTHA